MSPHSSDTEQEDTGDRATRAREGGLCTFFERRRVDGTRLTLAVETSLFRRASSNEESFFDFALRMSQVHKSYLLDLFSPNESRQDEFAAEADESLQAQARIEATDKLSFDEYLAQYFAG